MIVIGVNGLTRQLEKRSKPVTERERARERERWRIERERGEVQ